MLISLWDGAYKRSIAANQKKLHVVVAAGFLSSNLSGVLPYV